MSDLLDSALFNDVILKNKINNSHLLGALAGFLFLHSGSSFSIRKITNTLQSEFGISTKEETVSQYIKYLKEAYLVYELKMYDLKTERRLIRKSKFYGVDPGLRTALASRKDNDYSQALENIVLLELLRRGYQVYTGEIDGYEIDFIGEKADEKVYVQVSLSLMDDETKERKVRPLEMIQDNYPKVILSLDTLDVTQPEIKIWELKTLKLGS